jgi:hypothetical protein
MLPTRPLIHVLLPHTIVAPFVVHLRTATATILEASKAPITRPHGLTITTCRESLPLDLEGHAEALPTTCLVIAS